MPHSSGISISVESAHGPSTTVELSSRACNLCPFLGTLPLGTSLPTVRIGPFRIILGYLDGHDDLEVFRWPRQDPRILLLFTQSWTLAARLDLPDLQNKLVSVMRGANIRILNDSQLDVGYSYRVGRYLRKAFAHLHEEVDHDSQAERFLVCCIGRTTANITEMERKLRIWNFDRDVRRKILVEARPFDRNPIKYTPQMFRVSTSHPPQYRSLYVEHA